MYEMYSKKTMELFRHPKNIGKIKHPDGIGKVGNPQCGDMMYMYIKIGKNKDGEEFIKDVKVQTFGCIAAIATSSAATEMIKGKTVKEALELEKKDVTKEVGGLPPIKYHCSLLAIDGIKEAIYNYLKKSGKPIPKELEKEHQRIEKIRKQVEKRTTH